MPWWVWGMCIAYPLLISALQWLHDDYAGSWKAFKGQWEVLYALAWLCVWPHVSMQRAFRFYAVGFVLLMCLAGLQHYWGFWVRGSDPGALGGNTFWGSPKNWPATGPYSHHLTLAAVAMPAVLIFTSLFWGAPRKEKKWLWALGAGAAMLTLLFSLGRSGWLGLVVGGLVLAWRLPTPKALLVLVLGGGILAASVTYAFLDTGHRARQAIVQNPWLKLLDSHIVHRVLKSSIHTDGVRLFLWEAAWEGFLQRPWIGHGFAKSHFDVLRNAKFEREQPRHKAIVLLKKQRLSPHNTYLRFAVASGLTGLLLHIALLGVWLGWFVRAIRKAQKRANHPHPSWEKRLLWGVTAGLVSMIAFSNFQELFFDSEPRLMAMFWIGAALHCSLSLKEVRQKETRQDA